MRTPHGLSNRPFKVAPPEPAANGSEPQWYSRTTPVGYTAKDTARLLGGISLRSLRRLEQRGLLLPSRGLRIKLYSIKAIEQYLEETV